MNVLYLGRIVLSFSAQVKLEKLNALLCILTMLIAKQMRLNQRSKYFYF